MICDYNEIKYQKFVCRYSQRLKLQKLLILNLKREQIIEAWSETLMILSSQGPMSCETKRIKVQYSSVKSVIYKAQNVI